MSVLQVSRDKNCRSKEVKFSLRLQFRQKPQQRCVVKNPELCHVKGHSSLTAPVLMWKKPKERDANSYSPGESAKIFCARCTLEEALIDGSCFQCRAAAAPEAFCNLWRDEGAHLVLFSRINHVHAGFGKMTSDQS